MPEGAVYMKIRLQGRLVQLFKTHGSGVGLGSLGAKPCKCMVRKRTREHVIWNAMIWLYKPKQKPLKFMDVYNRCRGPEDV